MKKYQFVLEPAQHARLMAHSAKTGLKMSEIVRQAIAKYLEKQK